MPGLVNEPNDSHKKHLVLIPSLDNDNPTEYPKLSPVRYRIPILLGLRAALYRFEIALSIVDPVVLIGISFAGLGLATWTYCRLSGSHPVTGLINALGLMVFASQSEYLDLMRAKASVNVFEMLLVNLLLLIMPTPTVVGLLSTIWPRLISRIEHSAVKASTGHIVFLGIGQRAVSLINACRQSYEALKLPMPLIVAVDVDENAPAILELRKNLLSQFVFIKGDYTFETTLELANVLSAGRVYITGSDDLTNASAMSSINLLARQNTQDVGIPNTFIHLSSSRKAEPKSDNPYQFDVRVSASRLFLMMYPPFKMTVGGFLEQHRTLVLVGADAFNERVLQTVGKIWQAEMEQETNLLKHTSQCESFGFIPVFKPVNILVVDPIASLWVQAMKTRYSSLDDKNVNVVSIDVEPRFLSKDSLSGIGENPLVCFSVEKDDCPIEGLHQIYEVLTDGEIVCASWCRNPTEVIARELDSDTDKDQVHVRSFGLVDFSPTHKLLDGALWYDTAYRLHDEVYKSHKKFDLEPNLSAVIRYPYLLATCGIRIVSDPVPNGVDMERYRSQLAHKNSIQITSTLADGTESTNLAVLEHMRWLRESVSNGKKDNPSMKLWHDLDHSDKQKNNDASASRTGMPMLMADLGLAIQRVDSI